MPDLLKNPLIRLVGRSGQVVYPKLKKQEGSGLTLSSPTFVRKVLGAPPKDESLNLSSTPPSSSEPEGSKTQP